MAFSEKGLTKVANLTSATESDPTPGLFYYETTADNVAAIAAAGYFNAIRGLLTTQSRIIGMGSDGFRIFKVATVPASGNVTTTAVLGAAS